MTDPWFYFSCPMCRSRLRIKPEYTHMRGRCPACGMRVEPPDPKPLAVRPALHEPSGLLVEDEEWPEPATVAEEQQSSPETTYAVDDKGSIVPKPKQEEEIDTGGIYNLVFDPDAPKTPGVTRSAEWDQPGAQPSSPASTVTPPQPLPLKAGSAALSSTTSPAPSYEAEVDPLFGDVAKIVNPPASPQPQQEGKQSTPQAPPLAPVARLATATEIQSKAAVLPTSSTKTETASPSGIKKTSSSGQPRKPVADEKSSVVTQAVDVPAEETHVYELSDAEVKPRQADPPPKALFFEGVFDFAWRKGNWIPWMWLSLGFTLFSAVLALIFFLASTGPAGVVGAAAFGMGGFLIVLLTLPYASVCLQAAVSETATGNDRVDWPQESWRETFFPSFKIYYYYLAAALVTYPLSFLGIGNIGWQALTLLVFPAFLFCGLASANPWNLLHAGVINTILKKIKFYLIMYVLSLVVLGVGGTLFILSIDHPILVPVAGIGFPACWLIYSRLLGRMAFVLNQDAPEKAGRKRKKKKKKAVAETDLANGDSAEESSTEVDGSLNSSASADSHPTKPAPTNIPATTSAVSPEPSADVYAIQEPRK